MPRRKSSRRRGAESLPPRAESLGVLGLSGLLNPDYVDPDLDLAELEDSHVGLSGDEGGDSDPPADRPPPSMEQIIATHLDSTLREAGISTSDVFGAEGASGAGGASFSGASFSGATATSVTSYGGADADDDDDDDDEYEEYDDDDDDEYEGAVEAGGAADDIEEILRGLSGPGPSARRSGRRSGSRGLDWGPPDPARPAGGWGAGGGGSDEEEEEEEYDSDDGSDEYEDSEYEYDDSAMHDVEDTLGFDIAGASRRGDPILPAGGGGGARNLLGRAIAGESGAPGGPGGGFRGSAAAEAHLWEQKSQELDFIDHLREVLRRDNVDLDYIRFPTMDSTLGEIKEVSRILTQKSDTIRYSSLAEEGVNAFGKILGAVFNGERRVPIVGWRPDYRGVNQKLHVRAIRLRHQTSRLVGNFVNQYQLGDFTRLALDFLPTLITYPAENARSRAAAESWDDSGASRIRSNLARSESRRTTAASVADI